MKNKENIIQENKNSKEEEKLEKKEKIIDDLNPYIDDFVSNEGAETLPDEEAEDLLDD